MEGDTQSHVTFSRVGTCAYDSTPSYLAHPLLTCVRTLPLRTTYIGINDNEHDRKHGASLPCVASCGAESTAEASVVAPPSTAARAPPGAVGARLPESPLLGI